MYIIVINQYYYIYPFHIFCDLVIKNLDNLYKLLDLNIVTTSVLKKFHIFLIRNQILQEPICYLF